MPTSGFSLWTLFLQADWIVKTVMIGLIFASVWSWSIIFTKLFTLRRLHRAADRITDEDINFDRWEHRTRFKEDEPFSQLADLALREYQRSRKYHTGSPQRLDQLMSIELDQNREALNSQMGVLASVGSTAPFIGLFGTVWGIMNSFQSIAATKNTSLSVVAPGIAEALFATAIGLVVAIPAVIAYNRLTLAINSYMIRLENFAQELSLHLLTRGEP